MPPYHPPGRTPAGSLPPLSLKKAAPVLVRAQESRPQRSEYLLWAYKPAPPSLFLARRLSLPYILLRIRAPSLGRNEQHQTKNVGPRQLDDGTDSTFVGIAPRFLPDLPSQQDHQRK